MSYLENEKQKLVTFLENLLKKFSNSELTTARTIVKTIQFKLNLNQISKTHAIDKKKDLKKLHPVRPNRSEIYNVLLSDDNVGTELNGNHPCVIISNQKKNLYSEKVNVVPIEGDGNRIDRMNHIKITNLDLSEGSLTKDPSRAIAGDVMTIDKARLDRKIGKLSPQKMTELMNMVKNQLDIKP